MGSYVVAVTMVLQYIDVTLYIRLHSYIPFIQSFFALTCLHLFIGATCLESMYCIFQNVLNCCLK